MTALNKQALREEFQYMQDHYSDPADRERQVIYIAAEALLDELEIKEEQRSNWFQMAQKLGEDLDAAEKRNAEQREYYEGVIADGSKRIAELEKGHQEAAKQINSWRRLAKQNIAERGKDISELEAARQRIAELEDAQCQHESDTLMLCHQFDELASAMGWTSELAMKQGVGQLEYARSIKARIAELEAKLETADKLQDGAFRDGLKAGFSYGQTDDQSGFAQCMSAYSNAGIGVKHQEDSVDSDVSSRNQPGMVVAVHIDAGDFVKFKGQVFEVEETDFDDHDVTLWFVGGNTLKCAAGCQVEVVSAPVAAGIKVKG
ncbi:TPA_asm: ead/Ea22-like family protein [Salmonella enterica subsp. houtenae]|uniref:Ead/Ea22-like family protein n=1 Tax=Salmonella enterica TaxID=28901 RepID=A0A3J8SWU1_SALER|nr:ead/Ea22-like family protein [Salmonella enterica subsp. enterica serovar Oranienburg]EAX0788013.1 ead/Ea22-like family protein [Salmonella enterica]HAE1273670.1 ead/Ea22-like family protein [Salmonella enterica subsp. houtenae]EAX0791818.1 ead/Ea22-like family protein [Salmonella enterica]EBI8447268.1 ead/Ea22-like family protein [Salmonella enterica]